MTAGAQIVLTRDPARFAAGAAPALARLDGNLMATVLEAVMRGHYREQRPLFAYGHGACGTPLAAMRTPPWKLLVGELEANVAGELVRRWLAEDPQLPGVAGPPAAARAVASAWRAQTGGATRLAACEAMHTLTEVSDPPRPAAGASRRRAGLHAVDRPRQPDLQPHLRLHRLPALRRLGGARVHAQAVTSRSIPCNTRFAFGRSVI